MKMGRDILTGEYVCERRALNNPARYEMIDMSEELRKFRKMIYEPTHEEGGVCWCGVIYEKGKDGKLHIHHKSQRDTLSDAFRGVKMSRKDPHHI